MKNGAIKVKVLVKGKTIKYLPEILRRKQVNVIKISEITEFSSIFTIDYNDLRKFFAICKNMCYNTKVKGYSGLFSPVAYAVKHIGVTISLIIFIFLTYFIDGYVFGFTFIGTGKAIKSQLTLQIENYGVNKGSKFSDISFSNLSTSLLKSNPNLTFVSVYKKGNQLVINAELVKDGESVTTPLTTDLTSDEDGVVESVKVLRGTALVKQGDIVTKGSVLIGAYLVSGEETYPSSVLGVVTILTTEKYFFESKVFSNSIKQLSVKKAEFLTQNEVVSSVVTEQTNGYEVVLTVRKIYSGG